MGLIHFPVVTSCSSCLLCLRVRYERVLMSVGFRMYSAAVFDYMSLLKEVLGSRL